MVLIAVLFIYMIFEHFEGQIAHRGIVASFIIFSALLTIADLVCLLKTLFEKNNSMMSRVKALALMGVLVGVFIWGWFADLGTVIYPYKFCYPILSSLQALIIPAVVVAYIISLDNPFENYDMASFAIIGLTILIIIGQVILCINSIAGNSDEAEHYLKKYFYYYNKKYNINRDRFDTPLEMANIALEQFKEDMILMNIEPTGEKIGELLKSNSSFRDNYLKKLYGFDAWKATKLDNGNVEYIIYDMIYKDDEHTYKLLFDVNENVFKDMKK